MRICLIGPPTVEYMTPGMHSERKAADDVADRIPLGVLTLASTVQISGHPCMVVDLNREFLNYIYERPGDADFVEFATRYLEHLDFDLLGCGTMCSSYPASLRIAAELKRVRPEITIVLGGPQASVVDVATLENFSAIDIVVRGEADWIFPNLITTLEHAADLGTVPGITFRNAGKIARIQSTAPLLDLDTLPMPAFHLCPDISALDRFPIELGRGCPFACTFCSTNDFFRRKFRLRNPSTVIAQMKTLHERYKATRFILVHDMFTVDRRRVVAFCEAMLASGCGFQWSCSARTDCVDEELIELMAAAGCRSIFFGIETGSTKMQKVIEKDLDLKQSFAMIAAATTRGIDATVSTIVGFPEEEAADIEDTFNFLMNVSRLDHIYPQVGLLAPLAGTPLSIQYRNQLQFDPVLADFSYSAWHLDGHQFEMIKAHADIFSNFFAIPTRIPRPYIFELKLFFHAAFHQFHWLLVAAHQELGGITRVFNEWLLHRRASSDQVRYYISMEFKEDFLSFFEERAFAFPQEASAVRILTAAYGKLKKACHHQPRTGGAHQTLANPSLSEGVEILELPGDAEQTIDKLKRNLPATEMPSAKYLFRSNSESWCLVRLDNDMAQMLEMCDGTRSAREIIEIATGASLSPQTADQLFYQLAHENVVTFKRVAAG